MKKMLVAALLTLSALAIASVAFAIQYPPGTAGGWPPGLYPDTVSIYNLRFATAVPHPVNPDTVRGMGGIVIGFDPKPSGFGFFLQQSTGGLDLPWRGIDIFTGGTNKGPSTPLNFQIGDSVVVGYGKVTSFGGALELEGLDASQSTDDIFCRKVSSGNPLPTMHIGTLTELQELPTNTNAEPWEGQLVQVPGPLKVARIGAPTSSVGMGTSNSFILVDPTCVGPICDSLFIDGNTLTTYSLPAVGKVADWVQGIYWQQARGYRIQLRDGNDISINTPPGVVDAYMIDTDKVRVTYDRNVTTATATDLNNYGFFTGALPTAAVMDGQQAVVLTVLSASATGDPEQITVQNIAGLANGTAMTTPVTKDFRWGMITVAMLQGPNPDSLVSAGGCKDVANFLGPNNGAASGGTAATKVSLRGVCTGIQGTLYTFQDLAGGPRGGLAVFAPYVPLQIGHKYLVVGGVQEFPSPASGETEVVFSTYILDEGLAAAPPAVDMTVSQIRDTTCDLAQVLLNGEDVEGTIAKVNYGRIVGNNGTFTAFSAGANFRVVSLVTPADTFFVANNITRTFLPVVGNVVDVTGIVQFSFGAFRIQPRNNADIVDHGPVTGVINGLPATVQFAVQNPARTPRVTFGLPVRNTVDVSVFDLAGRHVATLAHGQFDAGTFSRTWDGLDRSGARVGSGMYFYRLRVGTETRNIRGIKLN